MFALLNGVAYYFFTGVFNCAWIISSSISTLATLRARTSNPKEVVNLVAFHIRWNWLFLLCNALAVFKGRIHTSPTYYLPDKISGHHCFKY